VTRAVAFAVPGDLDTPTGGYAYDKRIVAELRALGWHVDVVDLGSDFPRPTSSSLRHAHERVAALDVKNPIVIDGLAFGVMNEAAAKLGESRKLVALVHHPLAYESGISQDDAERFRASERAALSHVRHVVVTSPATSRLVQDDYGVKATSITVVRPGNERVEAKSRPELGIVSLLAVGSLVPRKGYDVLIAALAPLKDLPWTLAIAGDATRDAATADALKAAIAGNGLSDRVALLGAVSENELAELYGKADAFVLASRFEGYGMAYAEAIAHGLPVIATRTGAVPETVPHEAAIFVEPDDAAGMTDALRRLIEGRALRTRLSAAACDAARNLPTWRDSGELFSRVLEAVS
jgi:glycosyltransferase involved in cell wall biosynthesis